MNATQAKIRPLFDVSGSATATIQIKPEILALLKKDNLNTPIQSPIQPPIQPPIQMTRTITQPFDAIKRTILLDGFDEEELFMKEQRRSLRLANKRRCKNHTLKPIVPKQSLSELLFQKPTSDTNLKIKLPKRNSIISPSKIPPNPPRGEISSIASSSPSIFPTQTSLLTTQSPPSRPKSDPFRYNLRKRIDKKKTY